MGCQIPCIPPASDAPATTGGLGPFSADAEEGYRRRPRVARAAWASASAGVKDGNRFLPPRPGTVHDEPEYDHQASTRHDRTASFAPHRAAIRIGKKSNVFGASARFPEGSQDRGRPKPQALLPVRPAVTFAAAGHYRPLTSSRSAA